MEGSYYEEIFHLYADKVSLTLDYKQFTKNLYNSIASNNDSISGILEKLKVNFLNRGFDKVMSLLGQLHISSGEENRTVTLKAFEIINKEEALKLKADEIEKLFFAFYEMNSLNYKDFFLSLIDKLQKDRENIVEDAWKLITNNSDEIELESPIGQFDPSDHPKLNSETSPQELFEDYKNSISLVNLVFSSTTDKTIIKKETFTLYYRILSFFITSLSDFQSLLEIPFELDVKRENKQKSKAKPKQEEVIISKVEIESVHLKTLGNLKNKLLKLNRLFFVILNNQFISLDKQKNRKITLDLFEKAIKATKTSILKNEISFFFGLFENNKTGDINYETFLRTMINMNYRVPIITKVYRKIELASIKGDSLSIPKIIKLYNASNHPDVNNGSSDADEVYSDFKNAIKLNFEVDDFSINDTHINKNDFINFYLCYLADVKNDEYFEIILNNCWNLTEETYEFEHVKADVSSKKVQKAKKLGDEYEDKYHEKGKVPFGTDKKFNLAEFNPSKKSKKYSNELKKIISLLKSRGTRGIFSIRRTFDIFDVNCNGSIDLNEFKEMINKLRIELSNEEANSLFNEFDKDKNKEISYEEFLEIILGEFPEERETRLKQVFYMLDKNNSGGVSIDEIKDGYHYKRHPDVLKGRKSPEEIYSEFLDNLDYHFNLIKQIDSKELNFNQFVDFYRNISFCYEKYEDFSDYLKAVWGLEN